MYSVIYNAVDLIMNILLDIYTAVVGLLVDRPGRPLGREGVV